MASTRTAAPGPRITQTQAMDGRVYIATTAAIETADVRLSAGSAEFAFDPCPDPVSAGLLPRLLPFDLSPHPGTNKVLNGHGKWQVPEWDTLRVALPSDLPVTGDPIPLTRPVPVEGGSGRLRLLARLAVHRARGNLVVRLTGEDDEDLHRTDVPFAAQFLGSTQPDGYQRVDVMLPDSDAPRRLHVELDYEGCAVTGTVEPNVFFLADPRLEAPGSAQSSLSRPSGRSLDQKAGHLWYCADLPGSVLASGLPVLLRQAGMPDVPVLVPRPVKVTLRKDWGHVVELDSGDALEAMFWVNGEPAFPLSIVSGPNGIRLPAKYLTGDYSLLELRDPAGMQIYWQQWSLSPRQLTGIDHLQRESRGPFPSDLMAQSAFRYRALRAHCAAGSPPEVIAQLATAIEALEAGHHSLKLSPLAFPVVETPDVSVIIPAHNKVKVTYAALCGLLLAWNRASFEVIVVDDASTDETATLEDLVAGITVIRNEVPQRFIKACNAGVAASRGTHVVLLNNDTEPTVGWLDELIDAFGRFDRVGLAGARLLYPDGRQQEAGGIVWGSGDPWNYGRLQNPWEPRFCYARQVDYVSGAAMMTTRRIWDEVGGLSGYLEPMYFEDTDFAFKVRAAGFTTWYVPSSVVFHHEGLTSGADTASGFKRFQEVNRPKFKRRWSKAFAGFSKVGTAPDLEKDRGILGRVLFVDYSTPSPDRDAGSYAAVQEMRLVQSLGYKVTFLPENLAWMGSYTEALQRMGVEVIHAPFFTGIDDFLERRGDEFDAFYITRYHVMNGIAPKIRRQRPDARILMNAADLHSLRLLRKGMAERDPAQIESARAVREEELAAMRMADLVLSYTETEHAVIEALSEGAVKVKLCPWVLDLPDSVPPREGRAGLSFLGSFQHHPNVEGLNWFLREVMRPLAETRPDLRLTIYGSRMPEAIRALASPTIDPVGYVEDAAAAYDRHLVFVAPLLSGAGIKGKVLSALARGCPCVLSPVAAEGIGLRDGEDCLIARTPQDWAEALARLNDDAALWQRIADNARALALRNHSFARGRALMLEAFEAVDLFGQVD